MKIEEKVNSFRELEKKYKPEDFPPITMKDISELCDIIDNAIPILDLLGDKMLNEGHYIKVNKDENRFELYDGNNLIISSGGDLRWLLTNCIFMWC